MPVFPHVIEAPPERVFDALVNPNARTRHHSFYQEAESEKGKAGTDGHVARYRTKLMGSWRERLTAAERPDRVVFEELPTKGDEPKPRAVLEWRLSRVKLGTHVVLDVRAKNILEWVLGRFVKKYRYRRVVTTLKRSVEGLPESIVDDFPTVEEYEQRRAAEAGEEPAPAGEKKEAAKPRRLRVGKGAKGGSPAPEEPAEAEAEEKAKEAPAKKGAKDGKEKPVASKKPPKKTKKPQKR